MSFKDHFSSVSKNYSRYRPSYPPELYHFILSKVTDTLHAWDCATGNGQAAVALAQYFEKVTATDASAAQIEQAREHPKVSYAVAPAESSNLPDNSVSLITVAQALHWFDFEKFFDEVRRVSKKGAVIAAWSYGIFLTEDKKIDSAIFEFYDQVVGPYWPPERIYPDQEYKTIPFPFAEFTTPAFGIDISHTSESVLNYLSTWSAVKNYKKSLDHDPLIDFREKLEPLWGSREIKAKTPIYLRMGKV